MKLKLLLAIFSIAAIFMAIGSLFWFQELQYQLPTPVPASYQAVLAGQKINVVYLSASMATEAASAQTEANKPVVLHFFNPDCPCSRFNLDHFRQLIDRYKDHFTFYAVLQVEHSEGAIEEFKKKYDLPVAVIVDMDGKLAQACGVYSTPQAVVMDAKQQLYYRGNYNRARYCTDPASNFAQMALDSLLANRPAPVFQEIATQAYGCELPTTATTAD
jgi:peroxiredoxin